MTRIKKRVAEKFALKRGEQMAIPLCIPSSQQQTDAGRPELACVLGKQNACFNIY